MIYLNNAATTHPKPRCVLDACVTALSSVPASQFRGSHVLGEDEVFVACKQVLGKLFGIANWKRIYFTCGATDSMNAVIHGLNFTENDEIIVTQTEHNSVLRPLYNAKNIRQDRIIIIPCDRYGRVNPLSVKAAITEKTKAIFVNHCSNVTGVVQDIGAIGEIARKHGVIYIVDAAQSAGCIPVAVDEWNVDILVFTGHKGLFGIPGTGGFYVSEKIDLLPFRYGGTGKDGLKIVYREGEYEFEVGNQNGLGISALEAGVNYVLQRGVENIVRKEHALIGWIYESLGQMPNVVVYGELPLNCGPVVSFNIKGLKPSDVAFILWREYGIVVRAGFHCAPLIHERLGTEKFGTVRVSISDLTGEGEVEQFLRAVGAIQNSVPA